MIDLVAEFEKYEKKISEFVRGAISEYRGHDCYKLLDRRMNDLQNSADLKPASLRRNEYISHVVFPIVKEQAIVNSAMCAAQYRAQDIFSVTPNGSTPVANGQHSETVLNLNMANTFFKYKALKPAISTASLFGTSIIYTYWKEDEQGKIGTVYDQKTQTYTRKLIPNNQKNSHNEIVNLRDYYQDPRCADPDSSSFQGHSRTVQLSELSKMLNNPVYIVDNLGKLIQDCKDGKMPQGMRKENERMDQRSKGRFDVEIDRYEGTLPIKENEESDIRYCVEMIGDTIIRLSFDDYDDDISSYTVLNFNKRPEYWWGNSDCEYKLPHENFLNVMLSMTADNALRSMNQYVFYNGKNLSMDDISNRDAMGGFIPVDAKNIPISQLIYPYQPGATNFSAVQYAVNAVNESAGNMGTSLNFSKQNNGGTQNNKTAFAANLMQGQADIREADKLENFNYGVCDIGRKNMIMLQQFLGELFYIRPKSNAQEKLLYKYQILGRFQYTVNSTVDKNKMNEMTRLQNLVTWLSNLLANPQLAQAGYKLIPAVNDVMRRADLPSIEEVLPSDEQEQQAAMGPQQQQGQGQPPDMAQMMQQMGGTK